ncbi:MAG: hypothetical protein L3K26_14120 [Candidatus Hydrogenedentes bacterium]|nr:hypothetical protein [Candidatus Hydrogenedentota bacterium]
MPKFDVSCGLSIKQISAIKYLVKKEISATLPELPEFVETQLFFQGRNAWVFAWNLTEESVVENSEIFLEVIVKLKKSFHEQLEFKRYHFSCRVEIEENVYQSRLFIENEGSQ